MIRKSGGQFLHGFKTLLSIRKTGRQELGLPFADIAGEPTGFNAIETTYLLLDWGWR